MAGERVWGRNAAPAGKGHSEYRHVTVSVSRVVRVCVITSTQDAFYTTNTTKTQTTHTTNTNTYKHTTNMNTTHCCSATVRRGPPQYASHTVRRRGTQRLCCECLFCVV